MYCLYCRTSKTKRTYTTGFLGIGDRLRIEEYSELSLLDIASDKAWAEFGVNDINAQLENEEHQGEVTFEQDFPPLHMVVIVDRLNPTSSRDYLAKVISTRTCLSLQPEDGLILLQVLDDVSEAHDLANDEGRMSNLIRRSQVQAKLPNVIRVRTPNTMGET